MFICRQDEYVCVKNYVIARNKATKQSRTLIRSRHAELVSASQPTSVETLKKVKGDKREKQNTKRHSEAKPKNLKQRRLPHPKGFAMTENKKQLGNV